MSLALTEKQEREIEAFCHIAKENGALISLRELIELAAIDSNENELAAAFDSDSKLRSKFMLESGYVLERSTAMERTSRQTVEVEERSRERAQKNLKSASRFGASLKRGTVLVSVSGGNSFLSAKEDEDIDFFCVTKTNGMWPFMLRALVLARIHRLANREVPELCFSCIMDERWATQEFGKRQHPIFARDALTAKVLAGRVAYRGLLEKAQWMKEYFPAFYSMRLRETSPQEPQLLREGAGGKESSVVLNSFLYHTLGTFLRVKSWTLNRKLTKAGWHSAVFATRIGVGHHIYESNRYRNLRTMYGGLENDGG
ncbi:MAG TPA: hypothetical protein VND41_04350 [Nitrososphaerales archaeon]|nr:hypothetical protein [Nitrososphaerales archaeon]